MLLQMRGLLRGLLRGMPKNQNCERYLQPVAGLMIQQAREVSDETLKQSRASRHNRRHPANLCSNLLELIMKDTVTRMK
jgi:hypothetical protein